MPDSLQVRMNRNVQEHRQMVGDGRREATVFLVDVFLSPRQLPDQVGIEGAPLSLSVSLPCCLCSSMRSRGGRPSLVLLVKDVGLKRRKE